MADIRVPTLGESVTEATVGKWFKQPGDPVAVDEPLVELETDKVTLEVPAPAAGVLSDVAVKNGDTVAVGALLGQIAEGASAAQAGTATGAPLGRPDRKTATTTPINAAEEEPTPRAQPKEEARRDMPPPPSVRKLAAESGINPAKVEGTGKHGQVLKGDMLSAIERAASAPTPVPTTQMRAPSPADDAAREERVHMTRLRQTIARRLKDAQNTAAMLTTFNEVDMGAVMALREKYKDGFEKRHKVKLGFMGFFVRACIQALKEIPAVNAEIDGNDIVYKNYYHIGAPSSRASARSCFRVATGLCMCSVGVSTRGPPAAGRTFARSSCGVAETIGQTCECGWPTASDSRVNTPGAKTMSTSAASRSA